MALQDSEFYRNSVPDYIKKSFLGTLLRFQPSGQIPLFGLTSLMNKPGTAIDVQHGYWSKQMVFPKTKVTADANSAATTLTVDDTSTLLPNTLLRNQTTGELLFVLTVASGTSITVQRGVGGVTAGAITTNDMLYGVGNAFEQASNRPQSRLINPTKLYNNTHIFRDSWALPKTDRALVPIIGDSLVSESRVDCASFHSLAIEEALIFSQKSNVTYNGQARTTMDGLIEQVRTQAPAANTTTAGSTTTYDELEAMLEPCFNVSISGKSGNDRLLLVGGKARQVINGIGRKSGQYQIVDGQRIFGMQFSSFRTTRGTFDMLEHPLFNSNEDWAKLAIAVDLTVLRPAYLSGRQTENIEYGMDGKATDNGIDAVGGTLTTELTLENTNPAAHAVIWGLTKAA